MFPAFAAIQETPYLFRTPDEMSCAANRGGTSGGLFQVNHWIETTPAPRTTNAALVNARQFLLGRVQRCERERGRRVSILAVDFYDKGQLLEVVGELNGAVRILADSTPR